MQVRTGRLHKGRLGLGDPGDTAGPGRAERGPGVIASSAGALAEPYEALEEEECGILDGCDHGRCVRVPEGFTCNCFDGYRLDITRMACVGEGGASRRGGACPERAGTGGRAGLTGRWGGA